MENEKKKPEYKSIWQDRIADITQKILNREKFSFDLNGDALYRQYKDRYMSQGKQAMMDTMGQAQAMTGGYGNSYAQSVGQQTYQGYLQGLNDKIPDLYQLALDKYTREGDRLRDNLGMMLQQEDADYGRYRDQVGDQQWQDTFDYGKERDQLADRNSAYSKLLALMTGYGYRPNDAELAAAGMTPAQRDAILRIGAYAPFEEEETGGRGSYVPQTDDRRDTKGIADGIIDAVKEAIGNAAAGPAKTPQALTPAAMKDVEAWRKMKKY